MEALRRMKRKISIIVFILFGTVIIMSGLNYFTQGAFKPEAKAIPIYSVDIEEKKVALTFDSDWGTDKTDAILNILDEYNIKGTFFLVGQWCDDYPEKVKDIAKRGHEIGNHSNKHPNFTAISKETMIKELEVTNAKILELTGNLPSLFRFPEGAYNDAVVQTVQQAGFTTVQWDVDSTDWKGYGIEKEYNTVVSKTKPGSIVLFHNDGKYTEKTLPQVIEHFKKEGYEFVKVSDLLMKENYYLNSEGKQIKK